MSELAKIPPAKVYATLERLQERGLVRVSPGKPRQYSPVPMGEFLRREIDAQREQTALLEAREKEIASKFPILGTTELDDRGSITTLRGRRNVSEHVRERAACARGEILVVLPQESRLRLRGIAKVLTAAQDRHVTVRVLAAGSDPDAEAADLGLNVRPAGAGIAPDVAIAIFDSQTAILSHFLPTQTPRGAHRDIGIVTTEGAIVATLADLLRERWSSSARALPSGPDVAWLAETLRGLDGTYILVDERGCIRMWTRGRRDALTYGDEEVVGRPLEEVLPELADADARGLSSISLRDRGTLRFSMSRSLSTEGRLTRLFHLERPPIASDVRLPVMSGSSTDTPVPRP